MIRFRLRAAIALIMLMAACTSVNADTQGRSQFRLDSSTLDRTVLRVEGTKVSVATVLKQFARHTGLTFLVPKGELTQKMVSVNIEPQPLRSALDRLLQEAGASKTYTYSADGNLIMIAPVVVAPWRVPPRK
jgi:type II secretory pathway component GspD/PulD (secretin)